MCFTRAAIGAITNAITMRHIQRPGKILRAREAQYSFKFGRRTQAAVIRNPEMTKKPSAKISPSNRAAGA
ncbi:Uncharacterised protein [Mycobacteroides abscessus subsp. abscessus]|nr:Uncharacterised protein [Mycobacteroides abscessus subsp. abscessus]SHY62127.1 Uncharacterised protein [Mycobacteroides abscessus subsp. abscessus]SID73806.1 Uncharacterised protein [Mycobacteroides abscessus subsp. abscessus]SKT15555.1 Uncharacterised protein [Mycobacteroides abscessus subsp. abscessus]